MSSTGVGTPSDCTYPAWALDNVWRRWFAPARSVVDRLAPRPGDSVVDLGAGVGYFAPEVLARIGPDGRLTLVDVNEPNLQRFVRRHGPDPRVTIVVGPASHVDRVPEAVADRLLVANLLCDVVDKRGVMEEAWRILRPGGRSFVSFHAIDVPHRRHPLRVTNDQWSAIRAAHPWVGIAEGRRRGFRWFVLDKPLGD